MLPSISTLKGGYESGFRRVKPEEYRPRLLRFCKEGKTTFMRQVAFSKQSVHSGDVFILDLGDRAYQYNGSASSAFERSAVGYYLFFTIRPVPVKSNDSSSNLGCESQAIQIEEALGTKSTR